MRGLLLVLLAGRLVPDAEAAWIIPPTRLSWPWSPAAPVSADCGPFRGACMPLGAGRAESRAWRARQAPTAVVYGLPSASDEAEWQHVRQVLRSVYDDDGKFWDYRDMAIAEVRVASLRGRTREL